MYLQVGLSPEETVGFRTSSQPTQKQLLTKKYRHKGEPNTCMVPGFRSATV